MPIGLSTAIQAGLPTMTFTLCRRPASRTSRGEEEIGNSLVVREPVGVVGAITPWNYPLHQIAAKVAPALAAGCTVVLKPSEVAPLNAFILAEIIDEAGLPAGVFNLVTGDRPGRRRGDRLAPGRRHGLVHRLDARGPARERAGRAEREARRARAGRQVAERDPRRRRPRDGRHRRRREVLPQLRPDLQRADAHARAARARSTEAEQIAAAVAEALHGRRPVRPRTTQLGPLVSDAQRERVRGYIRKGVEEGATLVTGGADAPDGLDRGYFVQPTVFSGRDAPT